MKYSAVFPGQASPETFRLRGFILVSRGCVGILESDLVFQLRVMSKNYIVSRVLLNIKISRERVLKSVRRSAYFLSTLASIYKKKRINGTQVEKV